MRTRNRIALAATLLTFAFTGAASAQTEAWRDYYPDWTDGRDDGRYGDDARYRDPNYRPNPRQIPVLAHEIEEVATAMHRRFERNNRRPNRAEVQVMRTLHRLEQRAERFHNQVERQGNGVRRGGDEYRALEDAFYATARSLRTIGRRDYVERGMRRIHSLLGEVGIFYDRRGNRRGAYDEHGRYDDRYRDRDGRWDDDRYDDDRRPH
jgi:hypothetical protein